jgi:hypothetical protein
MNIAAIQVATIELGAPGQRTFTADERDPVFVKRFSPDEIACAEDVRRADAEAQEVSAA